MYSVFNNTKQNEFSLNNKIQLSNSGHFLISCISKQEAEDLKNMFLFYKRTQAYEGNTFNIEVELSQDSSNVLILGGQKEAALEMLTSLDLINEAKINDLKNVPIKADILKTELNSLFSNLTDNTDKEMLIKEIGQLLQQASPRKNQEINNSSSLLLTAKQ